MQKYGTSSFIQAQLSWTLHNGPGFHLHNVSVYCSCVWVRLLTNSCIDSNCGTPPDVPMGAFYFSPSFRKISFWWSPAGMIPNPQMGALEAALRSPGLGPLKSSQREPYSCMRWKWSRTLSRCYNNGPKKSCNSCISSMGDERRWTLALLIIISTSYASVAQKS